MTLRVRILSRVEPAFSVRHLAQHVVENALDYLTRKGLFAHLKIMQVQPREEGIVVKHFFEVRHEPARIG